MQGVKDSQAYMFTFNFFNHVLNLPWIREIIMMLAKISIQNVLLYHPVGIKEGTIEGNWCRMTSIN